MSTPKKKVPAAKRPLTGAAARQHAMKQAAKKAGAKGRTTTGIDSSVVGTHVPKGANRASAAHGRARHAQRTPLPPKGSKPTKTRTQSLRDAAAAARLDAARADGLTKAKEFAQFAKDNEWWAQVKQDKEAGTVTVTCKRDDGRYKETITVEWTGDRVTKNGGVVLSIVGGRNIVLRNVSAARKHMTGEKVVKREVQARRAKRERKPTVIITVNEDGSITRSEEDGNTPHAPVGGHIVDKWYDLTVTKEVKVKKAATPKVKRTKTKVICRAENLGKQQVDSLRRVWEADGLTVTVEEREAS